MQEIYKENKIKFQQAISNIVRKYRAKNKKSISLISAEIGMTKSMWADLERGIKDPQLSTLWRIAEGIGIPLSKLIIELERELGKEFSLVE